MKIEPARSTRVDVRAAVPRPPAPPVRPAAPGRSGLSTFTPAASTSAGDPNAAALVGLRRGAASADGPRVKQLQDDLIRMGYLDRSVTANAGYGNTFGPLTEAAVKRLQAEKGLPVTGAIDQATAAALGPQTRPPPVVPPRTYPGAPAGDPNAAAVAGLQKGGGTPAQIRQLQDDLLRMGYVDRSFASNGGYGKQFGPLTEAAVKQFQQDNGLPATGIVDPATALALAGPRPRAQGVAAGPALTNRNELGLPVGPLQSLADGSTRQDFDKGYVLGTPDGMRYVRTLANQDIVPPQKLGTATSIDQANASFLSQWGGTPWNSAAGAPYGYEDCGPTSTAMVLSQLGLIAHPSPANAEKTIDAVRDAALGYDSTRSQGTGDGQLVRALTANGAASKIVSPLTLAAIDRSLGDGHPLIVGSSSTWDAWGKTQSAAGSYLNYRNPGGHYVTVLGKAPDGNYIVGDPLSRIGATEVTPAQMRTLLQGAWDGIEVSRA